MSEKEERKVKIKGTRRKRSAKLIYFKEK